MEINIALIIGTGHLANRVGKLVNAKGYTVSHIPNLASITAPGTLSTIEKISYALLHINFAHVAIIYILDDKDELNLEILMAVMTLHPATKICSSLFNENMRPHLMAAHPQLYIINPAAIAAPLFAEALNLPAERFNTVTNTSFLVKSNKPQSDFLIKTLLLSFLFIILVASMYFHFYEKLSWLDALYFVVVTVSTVGYGDFNLQHSSAQSKIIGIFLILSSTVFIWMIFSLIIDRFIKKRVEKSMGRKKYSYKNHIIICGLGRLGFFVADELLKRGEKILIIEPDPESPNSQYFRNLGVDVYTGNARLPGILENVGIQNAQALIAVVNDDFTNLEIALNARTYHPQLRLILRIFDDSMAKIIQDKMNIHLTLSMSAIADESFANLLEPIL